MQKNFLPVLIFSLGLVGCASSNITNLTPSKLPRNSAGSYPVEMAWATREYAQKSETLQPKVQVGTQEYPMQRAPVVTNRWEAMVPLPENQKSLHYRFKVDYEYKIIGGTKKNSKLSPEYILEVVDKK